MSIASNSIITYNDFTTALLSAIKSVCCNIDAFASNIPARLRSGTAQYTNIKSITTSVTNVGATNGPTSSAIQTFTWRARNDTNLISIVTTSTINNEWNAFISAAGIAENSRSNKVIQAKDLGLMMGLVQQFMSYHLKPVNSKRKIFNTISGNTEVEFKGTKYITGTCSPKYTLTPIDPSNIPEVTNNEITTTISQNIINDGINWGIISKGENPSVHRCYVSDIQ